MLTCGKYTYQLDNKNRLRLPSKVRDDYGDELYLSIDMRGSLLVRSKESMEEIFRKLEQVSMSDWETQDAIMDKLYSLDGRRSFSNNFRADFHIEPFRRFTVTAMFRYTDPRVELEGRGLVVRPMTSLYRGELGLRYATRLEKWIFELSASVNGPCRVYDFMRTHRDAGGNLLYEEGYTQVYPGLDLKVTKRFRSVEIFAGGENLTGFRQKDILLGVRDSATGLVSPHQPSFDASAVWGPVLGARFYAGISFSLGGNDRR